MILAFLAIALFAGLLILMVVSGGTPTQKRGQLDRDLVRTRWQAILNSAQSGGLGLKHAVSEADKLLDYALKARGFKGETMADRLRAAKPKMGSYQEIWNAHKLRNALAHEVGFEITRQQAKEAIVSFERGLKDLGAL